MRLTAGQSELNTRLHSRVYPPCSIILIAVLGLDLTGCCIALGQRQKHFQEYRLNISKELSSGVQRQLFLGTKKQAEFITAAVVLAPEEVLVSRTMSPAIP